MVFDTMLCRPTNRNRGLQLGLTERLEGLHFTGDLCILAQSYRDMKTKLNNLLVEARETDFKINSWKTIEVQLIVAVDQG